MERLLAQALAADPDEPFISAFGWGQCRGMLALFRGKLTEALGCFERGVALIAEAPNPEPVEFRALWPLLLAATGDSRAPAELAAANGSDLTITFANRGLLGYAAAILAGAGGDRSAAADLALRADAYLARFPIWGHLARWVAAGAAAAGGWGQSSAWLAEAEPAFAAVGFDALASRCRRPRGRGGLTAREQDVLSLVGEGLPNKGIADRLHLSTRTVEKHIESLLRKTGSRSRTQLAVWAERQTT
jgi:DNA-binding CsgD family transcriptional regulator